MQSRPTSGKVEKAQRGLKFLSAYPQIEMYRLIVDGRFHADESGWLGYESREPGSLPAAMHAFAFALQNILDDQLSLDYFKQLHQICFAHVVTKYNVNPGHYRQDKMSSSTHYYLRGANTTAQGLRELFAHIKSEPDYDNVGGAYQGTNLGPVITNSLGEEAIDFENAMNKQTLLDALENADGNLIEATIDDLKEFLSDDDNKLIYIPPRANATFFQTLENKIQHFNDTMQNATDPEVHLQTIVSFVKEMNQAHPFLDGNIRTFVILLLNRLLIQNGFPPATLENPNVFDCYGNDELLIIVKQAMQMSEAIIKGKQISFAFQSTSLPLAQQEQAKEMATPIIVAVQQELLQLQRLNHHTSFFKPESASQQNYQPPSPGIK